MAGTQIAYSALDHNCAPYRQPSRVLLWTERKVFVYSNHSSLEPLLCLLRGKAILSHGINAYRHHISMYQHHLQLLPH